MSKTVIELPVEIGDRLYTIYGDEPKKYVVKSVTVYGEDSMLIRADGVTSGGIEIIPEQIGHDVYRTMDEAIEALRAIKKRREEEIAEFLKDGKVDAGMQLYVKYRGGTPVKYAYGPEWVATQLFMDDIGYDTPEEAKAAWEREKKDG